MDLRHVTCLHVPNIPWIYSEVAPPADLPNPSSLQLPKAVLLGLAPTSLEKSQPVFIYVEYPQNSSLTGRIVIIWFWEFWGIAIFGPTMTNQESLGNHLVGSAVSDIETFWCVWDCNYHGGGLCWISLQVWTCGNISDISCETALLWFLPEIRHILTYPLVN